MNLLLLLLMALPQDYLNLIIEAEYEDAINYCDEMIDKGKHAFTWQLEKGDIYLDKIMDFEKAADIYKNLIEQYKKKDGWLHYRLAVALEMKEDYLNAAKSYEIVATQFRKSPLDSFALNGVERCFKKNYQDFVASVDGYTITRLELDERMSGRSRFGKRDERVVLDQIILERLIYANAVKHKIMDTEAFAEGMNNKRKSLLLDEIRSQDIVAKAQPTEREMKNYYKRHKKDYIIREQIRGKEIVVESDSLARVLLDSLKKDIESFDTLAKVYSTVPSNRSGGNMGLVHKNTKQEEVDEVLFNADLNQVIGIIPFDGKFGIYLVTEHNPERYRDYEVVKSQVEATLKNDKIKKIEDKFLKKLKKKARIKIYEDSFVSDSTVAAEDRVVAVVNGREILKSDVEKSNEAQIHFARADLTNPEEFEKLLTTIIEDALKIEWAEKNKYFLSDGYVVKMKDLIKSLMENGLYRKIVIEGVSIDSQEVANYYKDNREEFKIPESIRCQEIVVDSKKLAEECRQFLLKNPELFDSLAQEHSIATTGRQRGDTGLLRRGMRSKTFDDIAFKLKAGTISKVFSENDSTYTIIKVADYNPTSYRPLEEVRSHLETRMLRQKQRDVASAFLERIKEEATIEIFLSEQEEQMPEDEKEEGTGKEKD